NLGTPQIIVAPQQGGAPFVNILSATTGDFLKQVQVYGATFRGGVRIATGDVTGDGVPDLITVPMSAGAPFVNLLRVRSSGNPFLRNFLAFGESFTLGLFVSAGKIDNPGQADIIVTADFGGAPFVNIFESSTGMRTRQIQAYDTTFTSGVR